MFESIKKSPKDFSDFSWKFLVWLTASFAGFGVSEGGGWGLTGFGDGDGEGNPSFVDVTAVGSVVAEPLSDEVPTSWSSSP